jgi:cell division protein FtsQ
MRPVADTPEAANRAPRKPRRGGDDPVLTSPFDIIVRAAATVPENRDPASDKNRVFVSPVAGEAEIARESARAPARSRGRGRRARRIAVLPWLRRHARPVALSIVFLAAAALPAWLWHSGAIGRWGGEVAGAYREVAGAVRGRFAPAIEHIVIEGHKRTTREALRRAVGVTRGDGLLATDPWAVKERLMRLPWVREASVQRRFPDRFVIAVVERVPIARLKRQDGVKLVDEAGTVIPVSADPEHAALPLLAGEGAAAEAPALLRLIDEEPTLARRVAGALRHANRRWDIVFDSGAVAMLPEGLEHAAWQRFAEMDRRHGLVAKGLATYDLRNPTRMTIRTGTPAAAPARPAPTKQGRTG